MQRQAAHEYAEEEGRKRGDDSHEREEGANEREDGNDGNRHRPPGLRRGGRNCRPCHRLSLPCRSWVGLGRGGRLGNDLCFRSLSGLKRTSDGEISEWVRRWLPNRIGLLRRRPGRRLTGTVLGRSVR